jgi:CheY-like chemotaxis protein
MFKQRVDTANNGATALEMVKKKVLDGFIYKLILMDCNMPKMDGYQCTTLLRAYFNELGIEQPFIIAVTGHIESQYAQRALDAGMDVVVGKPARLPEL